MVLKSGKVREGEGQRVCDLFYLILTTGFWKRRGLYIPTARIARDDCLFARMLVVLAITRVRFIPS